MDASDFLTWLKENDLDLPVPVLLLQPNGDKLAIRRVFVDADGSVCIEASREG